MELKKRPYLLKIFNNINEVNYSTSTEELVERIVKRVPYIKSIGYAGWKNRADLRKSLIWNIGAGIAKIKKVDFNVLREAFFACLNFIGKRRIYLFISPTFDKFTIKNLNGVSACTVHKNTIALYVNTNKNYKKALRETLIHEITHVICDYYYNKKSLTLLDCLINEGLAEHFREYIIGGGKSKCSKSISREKASLILRQIKHLLNKKSGKYYEELFLGARKYPLWAGYTIGYYLIEDYLKKQKKIDWNKILKLGPKDIFNEVTMHNWGLTKK